MQPVVHSLISENLPGRLTRRCPHHMHYAARPLGARARRVLALSVAIGPALWGRPAVAMTPDAPSTPSTTSTPAAQARPRDLGTTATDNASVAASSDITRLPELVTFVTAPYPAEAERLRIEAAVVLDIDIDSQGHV